MAFAHLIRNELFNTLVAQFVGSSVAPVAIRWVLVRDPHGRCEPHALLWTDQRVEATQIVEWCVMRWPVDVTFHDVRTHLGVDTQRHWSDLAMVRTTPALFGLFSLVTLCAFHFLDGQPFPIRHAAWSANVFPTFSDPLACVRQKLWPSSFLACRPPKLLWSPFPRPFSSVWSRRLLSPREHDPMWITSSSAPRSFPAACFNLVAHPVPTNCATRDKQRSRKMRENRL